MERTEQKHRAGPAAPSDRGIQPAPAIDPALAHQSRVAQAEEWRGALGGAGDPGDVLGDGPGEADPTDQADAWRSAFEAGAEEATAAAGVAGATVGLPHGDVIQQHFGHHDIAGIGTATGGTAADASAALGARAYAHGDRIAFGEPPDLHTAAHEAAHVIQQRGTASQRGGVQRIATRGGPGDAAEQHADAVADAVVAGRDAEPLLDEVAEPGAAPARRRAIQRQEDKTLEADAAALSQAFKGIGTDEDTVIRILGQDPARVRAIRALYDAAHDTHHRKGLVYDLQSEFTGFGESTQTWQLVTALLTRAGIPVPKGEEQDFISHREDGSHEGQVKIVASPRQPAVAPGTEVEYRLQQPASMYDSASRWTYQWHRVDDGAAAKAAGKASYEEGPAAYTWKFKWGYPGTHRVICRVQFISSQRGPQRPTTVEYVQKVETLDQMAKGGFAATKATEYGQFRAGLELHHLALTSNGIADQSFGPGPTIKNSGPNPAVPGRAPDLAYHTYRIEKPSPKAKGHRWYTLVRDWKYMPTVSYHGFRKITVAGQDAYDLGTGETARWIISDPNVYTIVCEELDADGNRLGTAARYVQTVQTAGDIAKVDAWRKHLAMVDDKIQTIDPAKRVGLRTTYVNEETGATASPALFIGSDAKAPGRIKLLDLTPGVPRSEYGGADVAAALDDFEGGNSYPVGQIEIEVPANTMGIATARRTLKTKGRSNWADWSSKLGWTSLGLGIVGIGLMVAPIPGSRIAAAAIFTSALAGGAASGLSIYDQLQNTEVSARTIAIDVLGVASSILGAGVAFKALKGAQTITLANRPGRFLLYTMAGTDVTQGLLVTPDFVIAIEQILADPSLSESERTSRIVRVVANFALMGGLIALSTADLRQARGRLTEHVDPKTLKALDEPNIQALSTLDDAALKALKGATLDDLNRLAALVKADATTASRLLRLLGDQTSLHQLQVIDGGALRINGLLDIHPRALAEIADDHLKTILDGTRRGDRAALVPFTMSGSYRLRFRFNLDDATDFARDLFRQLGKDGDPRVRALLDGATDAGKARLFDLQNASYPSGELGQRLKTKAADYALGKNPGDLRAFVEYFEMYTSEFARRSDLLKQRIEQRSAALLGAMSEAERQGKTAVKTANQQATRELLGAAFDGGTGSNGVKNAIRNKTLQDLGEDLGQSGTSAAARGAIDARYNQLAGQTTGRIGAGKVAFDQPDAALVASVKGLGEVKFKSESAAVYHANKHANEMPPSHLTGGEMTAYANSAQQTIRQGSGAVVTQQGGGKQIVFQHTYTEGGQTYKMTARVNVAPDGTVTLATYMGGR